MTLNAAIEAELPGLRAEAEALMTATCRITKDGVGEPTFNTTTGQYTNPARVTVYEGKCRIQIRADRTGSSDTGAGEREVTTQEPELQLPVDGTAGVSVNQQALILTSPLDASLVDRVFTIVGRHEKSHATARRLRIKAVSG